MKLFLLILILLPWSMITQAQNPKIDKHLQRQLEDVVKGFNGQIGLYVKNIRTNKIASINADTVFPTASMVKIPILIGVMDKINKGELQYHQTLTYKDSLLYAGVDILGSYKTMNKLISAR